MGPEVVARLSYLLFKFANDASVYLSRLSAVMDYPTLAH